MPSVHLIPVIEFDPFEHRADRRSPDRGPEESPAEWAAYWRDSLADAGITGLTPLPDTWVVPVDDVQSPELLAHVVKLHLGDSDLTEFFRSLEGPFDPVSAMNELGELIFDGVTPLRGGVALVFDDGSERDACITPECCGDLSNWREWQNATRAGAEWAKVWIGHPEARVRECDGRLRVQKVSESGEPVGPEFGVDANELLAATERAREALAALQRRLGPVLEPALRAAGITPAGEGIAPLAGRFAEHLAGLAEFTLD